MKLNIDCKMIPTITHKPTKHIHAAYSEESDLRFFLKKTEGQTHTRLKFCVYFYAQK
jgi:hypothetical protein